MKSLIFTFVFCILFSAAVASADGRRNQHHHSNGGVQWMVSVNNGGIFANVGPQGGTMVENGLPTFIGPNGGPALVQGRACLSSGGNLPYGAYFSFVEVDQWGRYQQRTQYVPPGVYNPEYCP